MGRVLGVDLGSRRIGVAVSDPSRTLATPLTVLARARERHADHEAIFALAAEEEADQLVVGWPRSLSGQDGPAARAVREEVAELEAAAPPGMTVDLYDERFTTVTATQRLREAGRRRDRPPVDAAAAAVLLQAYLDAPQRPRRDS